MWAGDQRHAPAGLLPRKTRYTLYRRLGGPQGRSGRVRKISHPTGIRSQHRPVRSESLYRLSYRGSTGNVLYIRSYDLPCDSTSRSQPFSWVGNSCYHFGIRLSEITQWAVRRIRIGQNKQRAVKPHAVPPTWRMRNANSAIDVTNIRKYRRDSRWTQLHVTLGNSDTGRECRANGRYMGPSTQHVWYKQLEGRRTA